MTARRLMRIETADGTLFVPAPAYRCWRCDALMPVEREREPLCDACEAASQPATTTTPATTHQPVYTGVVSTRDALMTEVGKLLNEGLTGAEVARRLTAAGYRSQNGAALSGANLLRDYRAWSRKRNSE